MHLLDHLLMFLLAVVVPLRTLKSAQAETMKNINFTPRNKKMMYYGNGGVLWGMAIVVLLIWLLSGRSLADLGLGWGNLPYSVLAWSILAIFVALYTIDLITEVGTDEFRNATRAQFKQDLAFLPANAEEFLHYLFLAFSAGICEEIVFRGYFIRYFEWLFPNGDTLAIALAICLPAVVFGVAHFYQGGKAVVKIIAMAVMFGAFFLLTGSLWPLIFLHALVDVLGGVVSWYLLGEREG